MDSLTKFSSLSPRFASVALLLSLSPGCVSETPSGDDDGERSSGAGGAGFEDGSGGALGVGGSSGGLGTGGLGTGGEGSGGYETGGQGTGGGAPLGSSGCGTAAAQATGAWNDNLTSGPADRKYGVWLPNNYDPMRAYPVILLLHGCGSPTNNVPMEDQVGEDAIVIRGAGSRSDGCWYDKASEPDLPYIDALLEHVQENFCVNPDQLFAVGYSSGSWVGSMLSCHRGEVFRGIGTVTGGEPGEISGCSGQVGRIFIHDIDDKNNLIQWDTPSRDRQIQTNHCTSSTSAVDPSPCVEYQDCDPGYPVVWCQTSGQGHSRQDNLAKPAFWNFFQRLMSEPPT